MSIVQLASFDQCHSKTVPSHRYMNLADCKMLRATWAKATDLRESVANWPAKA